MKIFKYIATSLLFIFVVGCQQAPEQTVISGNIGYLERIALLPNSQATISLYDVSIADKKSELITEQTIELKDKQVPIAFKLKLDADKLKANRRYAIRAVITSAEGRLLWTTDTHYPVKPNASEQAMGMLRLIKVSSPEQSSQNEQKNQQNQSNQENQSNFSSVYYQCDGIGVQASQNMQEQLALVIDGKPYTLSREKAASGEKYQLKQSGMPNLEFWRKGSAQAMLLIDDEKLNCQVLEQTSSDNKLANTQWQVATIYNQPLIESSKVTVNFSEQKIYGSAGCNQYTADYQLSAPEIKLSTIAVTKKACMAAELAEQESRFLALLSEVKQFSLSNHKLTLRDGNGNKLIAE